LVVETAPVSTAIVPLQFRKIVLAPSSVRAGHSTGGGRKLIPARRHAAFQDLPICCTRELLLAQLAREIRLVVARVCIESPGAITATAFSNATQ
jgi:hypothetical protein